MAEITFQRLKHEGEVIVKPGPTKENNNKRSAKEAKEALERKKYQKKIRKNYGGITYLLKGMVYYEDKLKDVMEGDQERIEQLFTSLQLFLSTTHKQICEDMELYTNKNPDKL